jgi:phospholipid/cholesterol/gamma-HCH transport system substrate-binding protein
MKRFTMETVVGIFVIVGLACVAYLSINLGDVGLLDTGQTAYYAKFSNSGGLIAGADVRVAGVSVGKVEEVKLDFDRIVSTVELLVDSKLPVTEDTIASIKTSGLIGDKFVQLSPGAGDPLEPGGVIIETESALDIEELIGKYAFGEVK